MNNATQPAYGFHSHAARSNFEPALRHPLVTLTEMAAILGVHRQTLRNWIVSGQVPYWKFGDLYRLDPIRFLDSAFPDSAGFPVGAGACAGLGEIRTQIALADFLRVKVQTVNRHRRQFTFWSDRCACVYNATQVLESLFVPAKPPSPIST